MTLHAHMTALTANSGDRVTLPSSGVMCIVGANNVGKSQVLRDVWLMLKEPDAIPTALKSLELFKILPDDTNEAFAWLEENAIRATTSPGSPQLYSDQDGTSQITAHQFCSFMGAHANSLWHTNNFLTWHVTAGGLLGVATVALGPGGMKLNTHPLWRLYRDGNLERELSDLCDEAFGLKLTLDRVNGLFRFGGVVGCEPACVSGRG